MLCKQIPRKRRVTRVVQVGERDIIVLLFVRFSGWDCAGRTMNSGRSTYRQQKRRTAVFSSTSPGKARCINETSAQVTDIRDLRYRPNPKIRTRAPTSYHYIKFPVPIESIKLFAVRRHSGVGFNNGERLTVASVYWTPWTTTCRVKGCNRASSSNTKIRQEQRKGGRRRGDRREAVGSVEIKQNSKYTNRGHRLAPM